MTIIFNAALQYLNSINIRLSIDTGTNKSSTRIQKHFRLIDALIEDEKKYK